MSADSNACATSYGSWLLQRKYNIVEQASAVKHRRLQWAVTIGFCSWMVAARDAIMGDSAAAVPLGNEVDGPVAMGILLPAAGLQTYADVGAQL